MKRKIIIEETITQEFEVEITNPDEGFEEIREMYKNGTLIINNPTLIDAQLTILDENGQVSDWNTLL